MTMKRLSCFVLAAALRLLLMNSEYQKVISDRVEVSTSLNSWKRVTEGVYLQSIDVDPYSGDLFHESPIGLIIFTFLQRTLSHFGLCILFILTDLSTAWILAATAKLYMAELIAKENEEKLQQPKNCVKNKAYTSVDINAASTCTLYIPAAYLINPFIISNCVGFTTTVFTNFLLAIALCSMIRRSIIWSSLSIALLTLQGLYPMILIVPASIYIANVRHGSHNRMKIIRMLLTFFTILIALFYISYYIMGSWSFLQSTLGFILIVPDLRPNIGVYWYFFTEMFEYFRSLFVASFQINVGLLYVVPLALRLRQDPMLLAFSYLAIIAIFKSYPCLGDVGFYMSLIPLWKHLFRHMQQGFTVGCFFLFCTIFAPTVWHQWIYSRSANANFYFGVTLAFSTAQIFLLTDILFASIKREFALRYGLTKEINENKAKLLLE